MGNLCFCLNLQQTQFKKACSLLLPPSILLNIDFTLFSYFTIKSHPNEINSTDLSHKILHKIFVTQICISTWCRLLWSHLYYHKVYNCRHWTHQEKATLPKATCMLILFHFYCFFCRTSFKVPFESIISNILVSCKKYTFTFIPSQIATYDTSGKNAFFYTQNYIHM